MKNNYKTPAGYTDYETYRNYDNRACEVVNDFLDTNFYPNITTTLNRNNNTNEQIKGVDLTFTDKNNFTYICDEKAAVKWSNRKLKTYAFELMFIDRGGYIHNGWLLADNQINNSYNLIYTDKINDEEGDFNYKTFTTEEIQEVTSFIVRKEAVINYFKSIGWHKNKFLDKCQEIRRTDGKCYMYNIETDGLRFYYSKQLPEKPINVLISREKLFELSDYVYKYIKGEYRVYYKSKRIK